MVKAITKPQLLGKEISKSEIKFILQNRKKCSEECLPQKNFRKRHIFGQREIFKTQEKPILMFLFKIPFIDTNLSLQQELVILVGILRKLTFIIL